MLILVRHGRTALNAAGLLQGRVDADLDEVGKAQAEQIALALLPALRDGSIAKVVSSPLARARQTAAAMTDSIEIDERWIEVAYGVFEGRTMGEVGAAQLARWRSDPEFAVEGGESLATLARRLQPALEELAETAVDHDVVVVSHVSPIKAAIAWALGVGIEVSWRCRLDQASISQIALSGRGPSLAVFNDTSHLGSTFGT